MSLPQRIRAILGAPALEWQRIAGERPTIASVYTGYVMFLAAIGPAMIVLSSLVLGAFGMVFAVRAAVALYVTTLIAVAVVALVADALAPSFGGTRDYLRSLELVAYSFTPAWLAQVTLIVPLLGGLVVLAAGVYAFYLFFLGAPPLRRSSVVKAAPYTLVVVLCTIVLMFVLRAMIFGIVYAPLVHGSAGLIR